MLRTLDEFIATLPPEERSKIADRARQLIAEELPLQDFRKVDDSGSEGDR